MRLAGWVGLALLSAGCFASDVDPTGSRRIRSPTATGEGGADVLTPIAARDSASEGCLKLIARGVPPRPDDPTKSLPDMPLELEVQYEDGVAVVSLQGPQVLFDRAAQCDSTLSGNGYEIDWDDGVPRSFPDRDGCSTDLRHEFHVGGTFQLRAATYRPGRRVGALDDSRHTKRLVIDPAKLESRDLPLTLSLVGDGRTFRFWSAPHLNYTVQKNRPVTLCVELRGERGVIGTSQLMRIRNHVDSELLPEQYFEFGEAYLAALRAGQSKFEVRAFLFDESKRLLERATTEPFRMTQLQSEELHTATFSNDGLNVTMQVQSYEPSCLQVDIDWGDGTKHTQRRFKPPADGCLLESAWVPFTHSYAAPGTYEVVLRSTEFDPWTPLEDTLGFWSYGVTVDAP